MHSNNHLVLFTYYRYRQRSCGKVMFSVVSVMIMGGVPVPPLCTEPPPHPPTDSNLLAMKYGLSKGGGLISNGNASCWGFVHTNQVRYHLLCICIASSAVCRREYCHTILYKPVRSRCQTGRNELISISTFSGFFLLLLFLWCCCRRGCLAFLLCFCRFLTGEYC